ncbi:Plant calmodulin-binding protein-related [Raphanus sativus]|uniref:Uncharacterized protein LOC108829992 n=1 Tax=Raphanus sativus TaxID=3726 RepID=A0A6J0LGV5_RAPSA|nr:uncharacterized protein LOC108829992 [Raphanus sativus]XP_018459105.2 uncharacterized protein LOC108829992 [Raphanus sativus]XP_018459106.2 uncharacterized protein LOC108829992 [Raphanus sativus]XP_018459107.2 uncharacterized protein LOC108829992 [Raphanus sativus]XP_018459108.2 uncharacterized protein LOC108829992 [Raphanus sativus]KAJ4902389.1 Plant calmodulin-binding protein-related [Raphanus sativus]
MDEEDSVSSFGTPEMMGRRDSTGKAKASKPFEKEIPRYLRASTGSCHDICKYGKRQVTLEKPWRSANRKIFKKGDDDALVDETLKPGLLRTKKATTKKVTPDGDSSSSEMVIKREVVKHQVSGGGVSSGIKKPIPSGDETPVKTMKKKVTSSSKLRPSPDSGSRSVDAVKPKVLKKSYSALATSKSKVNSEKVASSSVLKPKVGSRSEDAKMKKATASSRVVLKKVQTKVTPRASLSPRLRLAGTSSLKKSQSLKTASASSSIQKLRRVKRSDESNKEIDGYPVEEKTLHVVEMETKSKGVSEDDQNQQSVAEPFPHLLQTQSTEKDDECPVSETEEYDYPSGSNEAESLVEEETGASINGERKTRVRKEGESAEEAARKLHFRRGKVVDADDVGESARKLKFRRGRDLGEDKAQDAQVRRSFKKREDVKEDEEEDEDGEKVVLRHQDVQEKDAQGLLNNVIEETASKLVEARKSKVKALVGAFETVISLQESKPPAANSETVNSSPV